MAQSSPGEEVGTMSGTIGLIGEGLKIPLK
jgi:hypothetical protein